MSEDQYYEILIGLYQTHGKIYEKGTVIFQEGEPGTEIFFIIHGSVQVIIHDYIELDGKRILEGAESHEVGVLMDGAIFGELALLDEMPRSATVKTLELTQMIVFNKDEFYENIERYPKLAVMFLKHMAKHMRRMDGQVRSALGYDKMQWWITL